MFISPSDCYAVSTLYTHSNENILAIYLVFVGSRSNWFLSGLETLLLGGTCATVAFVIGSFVNGLLGEDQ
jgi:hypothetical protein